MPNLVSLLNTSLTTTNSNELTQPSSNPVDTGLNYQFMYKQIESAVEEIMVKYPNDPVVKELKQTLVRNLKPILEVLQRDI